MLTAAFPEIALASDHEIPRRRKFVAERTRRPLTVVFSVLLAFVILTTDSRWPDHGAVRELLFVSGICLATIGMLGRIWSNLFISGYKSRDLIQCGPYSLCRNPLYFFSAVGMTGIGLCTGTLLIPAIMLASFAVYYPMIIDREEKRLASRHGEEFANYCRTTNAFWPRLQNYHEPESYVMFPRAMRKNLADAFWFVALAAVVQVVSQLHAAQALPGYFRMW